jgi:transcriptional regulator with XRE-family HTH domain
MSTGTRHAGGRPRTRNHSPLFQFVESMADRRGLTLDQVADAAGVSVATVYKMRDPRVSTLKGLSAALRIPIAKLAEKCPAAQPAKE